MTSASLKLTLLDERRDCWKVKSEVEERKCLTAAGDGEAGCEDCESGREPQPQLDLCLRHSSPAMESTTADVAHVLTLDHLYPSSCRRSQTTLFPFQFVLFRRCLGTAADLRQKSTSFQLATPPATS